jgi:hypothetical protein
MLARVSNCLADKERIAGQFLSGAFNVSQLLNGKGRARESYQCH